MKRIGIALLLLLLLTGCGGVSKEEYDAVVRERDALLAEAELQELQAQEAAPSTVSVKVKLKGDFTATVRALIPDYVTDGETPRMAVVTLFQSTPFTIYTGGLTEQLETGETYVFEVKEETVEVSPEEYKRGFPDPEEMRLLWISGFRPAEEKDCGLDSVHLEYELCE